VVFFFSSHHFKHEKINEANLDEKSQKMKQINPKKFQLFFKQQI
jgi:hypothetical protein